MAVDLELLAAEDADFLLDDSAAEAPRAEPDDAMTGVWETLETSGGGAQTWWETDKRQTESLEPLDLLLDSSLEALEESSRPRETISPVSIEVKQTRTKLEANTMTRALSSIRKVAVSEDSQTESETKSKRRSKSKEVEKKGKQTKKSKAQRKVAAIKEENKLTPLEIRRKRNRESMQRARRRQRDEVERMKGTLHQLEKHYQELNEKSQARRRAGSHSSRDSMALEADYYALADLSHTLKEEKFLLEQMLVEKHKTHRRFQQVMVDRKQELELACPLTTDDSTLYSDYEYVPMTEDQANEYIRSCYQQMRLMEETVKPIVSHYEVPDGESSEAEAPSSPSSPGTPKRPSTGKHCVFPPSATFGWEVRHEANADGDFYVSFSKFFAGMAPQEAMMGSWTRYAKPESTPFRRQMRFEILQVINDSTYIAGSDIEHPVEHDKVMRVIFLNFRMQTEKGYAIGRHSVNPTSPEVRATAERGSNFEYVDNSNWVEFSAEHDDETGEPGCLVKFIARTEYNTQEDMYVRLVNAISRTMIWEQAVVPSSSLSLVPS
ncbi:hypothetical protein PHMEG_00018418 [Phytophthora megakarya]|uniref:Uncharacterized protein n=1 Tax=Phytophthora megakarya TaxID=4795 RepID=A0A225VVX9_9STRA|nr:hypothetical protein PHMEG_00018418 [Phytophthora megakarya]